MQKKKNIWYGSVNLFMNFGNFHLNTACAFFTENLKKVLSFTFVIEKHII